jgi:hypothetical protein
MFLRVRFMIMKLHQQFKYIKLKGSGGFELTCLCLEQALGAIKLTYLFACHNVKMQINQVIKIMKSAAPLQ